MDGITREAITLSPFRDITEISAKVDCLLIAHCRIYFTTLPSVLLQEQLAMIFLLKRVLVS
jgi:hypothetical protein